jgi:hypothetical protein
MHYITIEHQTYIADLFGFLLFVRVQNTILREHEKSTGWNRYFRPDWQRAVFSTIHFPGYIQETG